MAGAALKIPLEYSFRSFLNSQGGHHFWWMGSQVALVCIVPFALRLNSELGLPGAPFIAAKLAGREPSRRLRSLIGIAVLYNLADIGLSAIALAGLKLSGVLPMPVHSPVAHQPYLPPSFGGLPGHLHRFVWVSALAAVGAGVSEEILFRLSLFAIFIWLFRSILQKGTDRPSRLVLWCATIMQGYVFGLLHLALRPAMLPKIRGPMLLVGLAMPQTIAGIILGRLYLRRGLEASIIAHAMFDLGFFLLVAVLVYLLELMTAVHSGVSFRALTAGYG